MSAGQRLVYHRSWWAIGGCRSPKIHEGTTLDFWDLTKVIFRRWQIALPMLLLTAGMTFAAVSVVQPDYVATAYVQLVPPVPQTKPGQASADQRNPWLGQGLETLGNAAIITVLDQSVVDGFKAAGLSDSYTMEMGSSSPMLKIEVVGKTRKQAEDTTNQVVARFSASITSLQTAYGVATPDLITTRRLDLGTNVEKSDGNVKRALIAVAVAGLLLTAGLTVGLDAWLRSRSRRRSSAIVSVVEMGGTYGRPVGMARPATRPQTGFPHQPWAGLAISAGPNGSGGAPVEWRNGSAGPGTPDDGKKTEAAQADAVIEGAEVDLAEDATIVLPGANWHNGSEIPSPSEWRSDA
jgi:capsular polysaccharide biosynthesis protein